MGMPEAVVGWEETTQLLQGQVARLVSKDDSELSDLELMRSPSGALSRSVSI